MNKPFGKYSDNELLQAMRTDKKSAEGAFAEIYSRYSQRIYTYCIRVMGSPQDAQDIFQETFMKFYVSVQGRETLENLSAYLLTISRNLCINHKRDAKKTYNIDDYNISTNDEGFEQQELLQLIGNALDFLEFDYREAFVLRQYHGLSYEEIALITGETIVNLKNRVWRAKEKIKGILEPYLEDMSK